MAKNQRLEEEVIDAMIPHINPYGRDIVIFGAMNHCSPKSVIKMLGEKYNDSESEIGIYYDGVAGFGYDFTQKDNYGRSGEKMYREQLELKGYLGIVKNKIVEGRYGICIALHAKRPDKD